MTFKMTSLCFTKVYICILASQALGLLVDHKADIKPMNPVVFYGEILRLNCTLHEEINDVSASEMYFEISGINTTWTIKEGLKVTSRSIEADINITKEFYITTNVDCRTTKKSLRTTYIKADNPIQNITDFMGTYYYKDKIEVTWNLANTYWSTQVNTNWYFGSAPELNYSLPCSTATDTSCAIADRGYNGASKLFFKITVNLTLSNTAKRDTSFLVFELPSSATAIHSFNVDDHIKSGPPSDLTITHKTSTCFNFTWRNPEYIDLCKMCPRFYQIEFKEEDMMKWMRENSTTLAPYPQANSSIALCHLKPFTTYTLRFQVKGQIQQPWSDWTYITGSTNEDRPLYGPNLTETSFYEEKCTELNERKVYIYWQEPTASLLQGVLTYYEVEINNATDLLRKGSNYYIADLNCETDYNISIYAATKVGKSLQPSSIFIPARSKEIPVIKDLQFKVEEKFDIQLSSIVKNISATWDTSSADPLDELELYYCEEYYIPKICYDDYTTVVVNLSVGFLEIQNMNIKKNLFGYALKHPDKRLAGIHWTDCVYRADVEPKAPSGFQVNPGDVGSLTLTWRSEPCSKDTKTLILYYHISICSKPEFNEESCTNVTLNSSASNYTAYDLIEKHDYTVYLWAESIYKQGPKRSITATTRHKDDVSDTTATVIIAVVVSLGVAAGVAAAVIIYCICRKSKKRVMEFYKPALTASSQASLTNNNYLAGTPPESQVVVPIYTGSQEVLATDAGNLYDEPLEPENKATVAVKSETQGIEAVEPEHQAIIAIESENQGIGAVESENQEIVAIESENQATVVPPCSDTSLKQPKPSSHVCDPEGDSNSLNDPNNSEGMNRQVEEYIRMAHHGDTNLATTDLHLSSPSEITLTSDKLKHPFREIDVFYIREDIRPKNVRDAGRNVTKRNNHDLTQLGTEQEEAIDPEQSVPEYVSINSTSPDIDASCSRNNRLRLISDQFSKPPITVLPVLAQEIEDRPVVKQVHSFPTSTNNVNTLDYLPVPSQVHSSPSSTNSSPTSTNSSPSSSSNVNTLDYLPVPTQVISSPATNNVNTLDNLPVPTQVNSSPTSSNCSPTSSNNMNTLDYLPVATQLNSSPTSSNCSPTSSNNMNTLDYLPVAPQVNSSSTSSNNMNTLDYLPVPSQVNSSPTSSNNMNTLDYLPVPTQVNCSPTSTNSSPTSSNSVNTLDYLPVSTALLNQQIEFITEDDSSSNVSDVSSVRDISFGTNTSYLDDESVLQDLPTILNDPSQHQYNSSGGLHNGVSDPSQHQYNSSGGLHNGVSDPSQHQYNSSGGLHNGVSDPNDSQYNSSDSMESDSLHNSETTEHLLHNGYISHEYPNEVESKSPVPIADLEKGTNKLHNGYVSNTVSNMFSNNSWDHFHNTPGV
ncbi:uncharacterized protein LOC131926985 isoform X2 [Physella acuta]|uniref:uncharacterized protein LOC131926985 isoform X2 n=1 Tax=Physella acuta TaxID=109671 RepID=UPI0027DB9583|nr:uncharacterized protein LOC131926985 isoform X2 [Physella acuta]